MGRRVRGKGGPAEKLAEYDSGLRIGNSWTTPSTRSTNILDDVCERTKRLEKVLEPAHFVKAGHLSTPFCDQGYLDETIINDAILGPINKIRTDVNDGKILNMKSSTLPPGTGIPQLSWSCDLEIAASKILNNSCPILETSSTSNICDLHEVAKGANTEDIAYEIDFMLTDIDYYKFEDYTGDVIFKDERGLHQFANLINQNATQIGCHHVVCADVPIKVLTCLIDQPFLKYGDIVYKRAYTSTYKSSTTAPTTTYTSGYSSTLSSTSELITSTYLPSTSTVTMESSSITSTPETTTTYTSTITETTSTYLPSTSTVTMDSSSIMSTSETTTTHTSTITEKTSTYLPSTSAVTMDSSSIMSTPETTIAHTSTITRNYMTTVETPTSVTLSETVTTGEPDTMCPNGADMTDSLRNAFLVKHNALRSALAVGSVPNGKTNSTCRKASKMPMLVYCCELEKTAFERASQCDQMDTTPQGDVSENNYIFTEHLNRTLVQAAKAATQVWWSEMSNLESSIDQVQNLYYTHLGITSFAKIASDLTTGFGCAVVRCENRINVVCHYDTTLGNAVKLYTYGPTCNKCENGTDSCVNGLCPAASETCSTTSTTETPEIATTSVESNVKCPDNHGMTDPLRSVFLQKHNTLRSALALGTVENGQTGVMCRKASKMPALVYNCKLENTAIERASQCNLMASTPPQNISENSYNFTIRLNRTLSQAARAATQVWWSELSAVTSGIDQVQNIFYTHLGISSFGKIASDLTTKVGCAVIRCTNLINVICHYESTLTNAVKLYTTGPACKKCENGADSCVNGLCQASSE